MFTAAEVHLLDTGHFALKTHAEEIAKPILKFFGELLRQEQVKLECVRYSEDDFSHGSSLCPVRRPARALLGRLRAGPAIERSETANKA